jgi:hypothetical protein
MSDTCEMSRLRRRPFDERIEEEFAGLDSDDEEDVEIVAEVEPRLELVEELGIVIVVEL